MKHSIAYIGAWALGLSVASRVCCADLPVKNVTIAAGDTMRFSVTRIDAAPGQPVHVQLKNEGTLPRTVMGHNWVLLKLGVDPNAYAKAAMATKDSNYQPRALADEVIAATPLVGAKETADVTFVAPRVPGKYAFLCSYPAHCQIGMRGELVVQ